MSTETTTPNHLTDDDKSETSSYKTAPILTQASEVLLESCNSRRHTADSTAKSETASFKQREAELESIAQRFVGSKLLRDPSNPVTSRFREEFNSPAMNRQSIFAKFLSRKTKPHATLVKQRADTGSHQRHCVTDAIRASQLAAAGPNVFITVQQSTGPSTVE